MLKRSLSKEDLEYEIGNGNLLCEHDFLQTFKEVFKKYDIKEYQIIVNRAKHFIEIRIQLEKLHICFSERFELQHIFVKAEHLNICGILQGRIKNYAISLCYKED